MSEAFVPTHQQAANLPDNQRLALEALLGGARQAAAARAAGVCVRTLQRWLQEGVFVSALHQARAAAWLEASTQLQVRACHAIETLEAVMDCDRPHARVSAARTLLTLAARTFEIETLYQRVLQVEGDLDEYIAGGGKPLSSPASSGWQKTFPTTQAEGTLHSPLSTSHFSVSEPPSEVPVAVSHRLLEEGVGTRHFATFGDMEGSGGRIPGLSTVLGAFRNRLFQQRRTA